VLGAQREVALLALAPPGALGALPDPAIPSDLACSAPGTLSRDVVSNVLRPESGSTEQGSSAAGPAANARYRKNPLGRPWLL